MGPSATGPSYFFRLLAVVLKRFGCGRQDRSVHSLRTGKLFLVDLSAELVRHVEGRTSWLSSAADHLAATSEVLAVLAYGSIGRGDADARSDVDLIVIFEDEALAGAIEHRLELPRLFGEALTSSTRRGTPPSTALRSTRSIESAPSFPCTSGTSGRHGWRQRCRTTSPSSSSADPAVLVGGSAEDLLSFERRPRVPRSELAPSFVWERFRTLGEGEGEGVLSAVEPMLCLVDTVVDVEAGEGAAGGSGPPR